MEVKEVLKMVDHTNLKQGALEEDIIRLCDEAKEYGFCSVCVHPSNVPLAAKCLKGSDVKVCTVVGFPLGENLKETKAAEAKLCAEMGAEEIDMVISNSLVKRGEYDKLAEEVNLVHDACPECVHKVIIETSILTKEEIEKVCETLCNTRCDFIKTSTGFVGEGATVENVVLMNGVINGRKLIKAAGGIRGGKDALDMIAAGASRLGTSKGAKIAEDLLNN